MTRTVSIATCLLTYCLSARAQLTPGDILVTHFIAPGPDFIHKIQEYAPTGAVAATFNGTCCQWIGCSITPDGRVVTTRRTIPPGVNVFDADGTEVFTFETPEIFSAAGDINVFSDGVYAICDQGSNWIETYSVDVENQTATYLGPIAAPPGHGFFGGYVDGQDQLWTGNVLGKKIFKFSRSGQILDLIGLDFEPGDIVVDANGTLWISARQTGEVMHLTAAGQFLESFPTGVEGFFWGIAVAEDGTLYATGEESAVVRHLSPLGDFLDSFDIVDPQVIGFLNVVPPPPPLLGDWDEDGDVDIADYKQFRQCARGPGVQASGACRTAFDFDNDLDVDLHDWWVFHQAFTGEILPANQNRDRQGAAYAPPDKRIKRKRVELIPPAYPEAILDVEADPDRPEVVVRRK